MIYYQISDLKFSEIGLPLTLMKRMKKNGTGIKEETTTLRGGIARWYQDHKLSKYSLDSRIHEIRYISPTSLKISLVAVY